MAVLPSRTWQRLAWLAGGIVTLDALGFLVSAILPAWITILVIGALGVGAYEIVESQW